MADIPLLAQVTGAFEGVLTNLFLAIIILFVGFIIGRLAGKLLMRILRELETDVNIAKATRIHVPVEATVGHIVEYGIYVLTLIFALDQLSLTAIVVNMILIVLVLLIAFSFLLAIKDYLPNAAAGLRILITRKIRKGNVITWRDITGKVVEISLVETRVETEDGDLLYIPNANFNKKEIVKISRK